MKLGVELELGKKVFQMVSKIWDIKLPKISQLHGNFAGKQTFTQEDIHTYILHRSPFIENDISIWLQKLLL